MDLFDRFVEKLAAHERSRVIGRGAVAGALGGTLISPGAGTIGGAMLGTAFGGLRAMKTVPDEQALETIKQIIDSPMGSDFDKIQMIRKVLRHQ